MTRIIEEDRVFTILSVFAAAMLLATLFRVAKPHFSFVGGSRLWILLSVLGFLVYLLGSIYSRFEFQWMSLPLFYLGTVAFLAGSRVTLYAVPSVLALILLPLPFYLSVQLVDALDLVLVSAIALSGIAVVTLRPSPAAIGCEYCKEGEAKVGDFCEYCGKIRWPARLSVDGKRLAGVAMATALIIFSVSVSLPLVTVSDSGVYLTRYSLAGVHEGTALATFPGWSSELSSSSNGLSGSIVTYPVNGKGSDASVSFSISSSRAASARSVFPPHVVIRKNGSQSLAQGESAERVYWSEGGKNMSGLTWSTYSRYVSGVAVESGYLTLLLSTKTQTSSQGGETRLLQLSQTISSRLAAAKQGEWFLTYALGPLLNNLLYVQSGAAFGLFALAAGIARSADFSGGRRLENSLGLRDDEFALLTYLSAKGARTGSELLKEDPAFSDWQTLRRTLGKLKEFSLVTNVVQTRMGVPYSLWESKVT